MPNRALAATFVGLNVLDAALTQHIVGSGLGTEFMPLMRHLLKYSLLDFWLVKAGGSVLFATILVLLSKRFEASIRRVLQVLVLLMVLICLINIVGLILV